MFTSIYQIDTHFGGKPPLEHQLQEEINDAGAITRTVLNVRRKGNFVYIDFNQPIGVQKSYLDAIVSSHSKDALPRVGITSTPKVSEINSSNYTRVLTWVYKGEKKVGDIVSIDAVTYISNSGWYAIRIWDRTNNKLVAYGNFNNNDEESVSLNIIKENVPSKQARIDISIKKNADSSFDGNNSNGNGKVYILGVTFGLK